MAHHGIVAPFRTAANNTQKRLKTTSYAKCARRKKRGNREGKKGKYYERIISRQCSPKKNSINNCNIRMCGWNVQPKHAANCKSASKEMRYKHWWILTKTFLSSESQACWYSVMAVSGGHIGLLQSARNVIFRTSPRYSSVSFHGSIC